MGIGTSILCKIYRSFRIYNYFLIKINISGAINVFVTLGIKKLRENVNIFLLLPFLSSSLKTPNCCASLELEPWLAFLGLEPWSSRGLYLTERTTKATLI